MQAFTIIWVRICASSITWTYVALMMVFRQVAPNNFTCLPATSAPLNCGHSLFDYKSVLWVRSWPTYLHMHFEQLLVYTFNVAVSWESCDFCCHRVCMCWRVCCWHANNDAYWHKMPENPMESGVSFSTYWPKVKQRGNSKLAEMQQHQVVVAVVNASCHWYPILEHIVFTRNVINSEIL